MTGYEQHKHNQSVRKPIPPPNYISNTKHKKKQNDRDRDFKRETEKYR